MLWTIIWIILGIWLIGLLLDFAGGLIHILLIIAGIIFIYQLVTGKRSL
ncbi:lmo0937 family membrane protein [Piscibacillus sp. B03]